MATNTTSRRLRAVVKAAVLPLLLMLALTSAAPAAETPAALRSRAESLLTEAMQQCLQGAAVELAKIDEALALYRRSEDRNGEALALVVRAFAAISRSDYASGSRDLDAAVALFEAAGDRVSAALFLWMAGGTARLDDQSEAALARLERSLALLDDVVANPRGASFAGFFATARLLAPSLPLMQVPPLEAATPMLATVFAGAVRDELGGVLVDLERLDEAETQLARAQVTSQMLGGMFDMSIYAHLGALRRRQWRLEEAKGHLERSLKGTAMIKLMPFAVDHRLEIQAMGRLAEIESLLGRPEPALQWNAQALELARGDGVRKRESSLLEDRGRLLLRHDRLGEAEAAFQESLRVAQDIKDSRREASVQHEIGNLAFVRGDFEQATRRLELAADLYKQLGDPMLETTARTLLFEVYARLGAADSAATVLQEARDAAEKDSSPTTRASLAMLDLMNAKVHGQPSREQLQGLIATLRERLAALRLEPGERRPLEAVMLLVPALIALESPEVTLSEAELRAATDAAMRADMPQMQLLASFCLWTTAVRQGKLADARVQAESALAAATRLEDGEMVAYSLLMQAVVALREQKKPQAIDLLRRAVDQLEQPSAAMRTDALLAAFFGGARRIVYDLAIGELAQSGLGEEAFALAERARARALLHQLANTRVGAVHGGDPALVARAEALRRTIAEWQRERDSSQGVELEAHEHDLEHAKVEYGGLMTRIQVTNPEYASLVAAQALDLPAVQRALAPGQTLVSYFTTSQRVHAWVVSPTSFVYVPLAFGEDGAEDVRCLSAELGRFSSPAPAGVRRAVARGVEPLGECPPDPARAVRLHQQLVAPLLPAVRGSELVLVPHGVLHRLPFAALHDAGGEPLVARFALSYLPSASVLPFLAGKRSPFQGRALVLGAPAVEALQPLPGAEREAAEVAALWGTKAWLGSEANEGRLYGLDGKVDLIHVAAHGFVDADSGSFSRIALAADAAHDGDLEVRELLSEVDLSGVNLVVLSACDTGLGKRSGGDEIASLARAILYAGSPAVVSTLWRVDDAAAIELMASFYRRLQAGVSAAESLRQAQVELRQRFPDPYYWAAFTLTGELTLQPPAVPK